MGPGLILAVVLGFALGMKGKPQTQAQRSQRFGSRSGRLYTVEEFADVGFLVVYANDTAKSVATFRHDPGTRRTVFSQGRGNPTMILMMREDFETPPQN